jgi:hypothetical protein
MVSQDEHLGPLAEFTALRAEILQNNQNHNHVLTFQVTISGAILGIVVSRTSLHSIALVIPVVSEMLYLRYLTDVIETFAAAEYIDKVLSERVPGGLHWETWSRTHARRKPALGTLARLLNFAGASVLALAWAFDSVFLSHIDGGVRAGLIALWLFGTGAAIHQIYLTFRERPTVATGFRATRTI